MIGIDPSMFELFREEVRAHADTLSQGLLDVEADPGNPARIEPLMRAAHSIKGASRIVGIDLGVRLSHVMEDALVAAQNGKIRLTSTDVDVLLKGSDVLGGLAELTPETILAWETANARAVEQLEPVFQAMAMGTLAAVEAAIQSVPKPPAEPTPAKTSVATPEPTPVAVPTSSKGFPPVPAFEAVAISPDPRPLPSDHSMLDLFREELRSHLLAIVSGLGGDVGAGLESLKQIRGAARIIKCPPVERVTLAVAGFLSAVRETRTELKSPATDWLRLGTSTLASAIATDDESFPDWVATTTSTLSEIADAFEQQAKQLRASFVPARPPAPAATLTPQPPLPGEEGEKSRLPLSPGEGEGRLGVEEKIRIPLPDDMVAATKPSTAPLPGREGDPDSLPLSPRERGEGSLASVATPEPVPTHAPPVEAVVRVTAQSLNRLMGLAGESLVQARWLPSFSTSLLGLKKRHDHLAVVLDGAFHAAAAGTSPEQLALLLAEARRQAAACRADLTEEASDFDDHAARAEDLNARLYREVIVSRMRPFGDGVHGLPRLVRDMARSFGKEARLVIDGEKTEVDRDVLEKLESPLSHLVRNAVDHGLEMPAARTKLGKQAVGTIRIEARHRAGVLQVTISDDGGGVDLDRLRRRIVDRGLNAADMVQQMTEPELLEFLFLPGFSTAAAVTEFSGRGVGLDVVQDTIRKVGGSVRITTQRGRGTTFHLQLPLTLSVIRAVVVDVSGEPYAFPHTRIDRLIRIRRDTVRSLEHRQFAIVDGQNVGLVVAAQLLDLPPGPALGNDLAVVLLSDSTGTYGLVVDSFRGEQDLVVRPLDPRLGKVPNLSAAAILDDGSPVLIVDAEDLLRSTDQFIQTGSLKRCETRPSGPARKERVLVVDDSITVREVERQLLLHRGYDVSVAVDGMDGWNKVRAEKYDLLVSDVDMPRMSGLQLVTAVRGNEKLRDLPVVIVSYKEREEDRLKGLEVGANCYLTKSSFHDNRFIEAVADLIGTA